LKKKRCTKVRAVLTGQSTVLRFVLAWFSSLSSECLCVFGLHGALSVKKNFAYQPTVSHHQRMMGPGCLHFSAYLAEPDWIGP